MTTDITPTTPSPSVLQRGEGPRHHFLGNLATTKATAHGGSTLSAVEFLAPYGFGPPLHRHREEDELIVVLEGEVAFRSGDDETVATEGATAFLPRRVAHTFQVLSEQARMLSITASTTGEPIFDRMVAALGEPTTSSELPPPPDVDPDHVTAVNAEHGIEVLGPPPAPLV